MRLNPFMPGHIRTIGALAGAALAASVAAATPASADALVHDHVYADSFGNLVIYSPSGYKRIVVGQGHLAAELSNYSRGAAPEVVYAEPPAERAYVRRCVRAPGIVKGRSYMYGLPDGVVPVISAGCY